jgi:hypothetical protein
MWLTPRGRARAELSQARIRFHPIHSKGCEITKNGRRYWFVEKGGKALQSPRSSQSPGWGHRRGRRPVLGRSSGRGEGGGGELPPFRSKSNVRLVPVINVESITTPSGGARCAAAATQHRNRTSQPDSLDFTQCYFVLCSIVQLRCSRRLMSGHLLGVLEPCVVLQVNRDAGRPPGVTSDGGEKARSLGPLPNRSSGVVPI